MFMTKLTIFVILHIYFSFLKLDNRSRREMVYKPDISRIEQP